MSTDFARVLLRLKEQLAVADDKEVAAILGMTDKAFAARKARGAFPEDKLFALMAKRPDLRIDPAYVMTGVRHADATQELLERAAASISPRDAMAKHLATEATKAYGDLQTRRAATNTRLIGLAMMCDNWHYGLLLDLAESLSRASHHAAVYGDRQRSGASGVGPAADG